jgi:hypothetical protein
MNSSIVARPTVDTADENEIEVSTPSANMDYNSRSWKMIVGAPVWDLPQDA